MPVFTRDGRAVLFVHIPKTGGTSVERAFVEAGWTMRLYSDDHVPYQAPLLPYRRVTPQHFHATLLAETLRLDRMDAVFTIVRDPVARFRSEYAMHHRDRALGTADHVDAWADRAFAAYRRDPFVLDNHLRPQVEYLVGTDGVHRYEDGLDTILAGLDARLDLGLAGLPHCLASGRDGSLSSAEVEIGDRTRALLAEVYADDFRLLGYAAEAGAAS